MTELDGDEGWTGGHEVHMPQGRLTCVLGPDGDPVRYLRRHKAGFDLRSSSKKSKDTGE